MKTLLDVRKGVVEIVDMPKPVCTDDTLLVQNIFSGISNGTERNVLMGGCYGRGAFPDKCNYQPVARVVEVGKNIRKYKVGDIVIDGTVPGHVQYHLLKETDLMAKVPEGVDLLELALYGVSSVACHDALRVKVCPTDRVLVLGAGVIGQMIAQCCRAFGAEVTVADLLQERLDCALELGTDYVYNLSDPEQEKVFYAKTNYFSVLFETTSSEAAFNKITGRGFDEGAASIIGKHARIVMVGGRYDMNYNSNAVQINEARIYHVHHFDQIALDTVVRFFKNGIIRTKPLITRVVPFNEAPALFEIMRDDPSKLFGTVIDWRDVPAEDK